MSLQINFNGKTYNSIDEMPPEARQAYAQAMALLADQNANGIPDFLDGLLEGQSPADALGPLNALSAVNTQIVYNGQAYTNLDDMPAEARAAYQQALGTWDQNRNGIPDAFEHGPQPAGGQPPPVVNVMSASGVAGVPRAQPTSSAAPAPLASEVGAGRPRMLAVILFALAAVCLVAVVLLLVFVAGPSLLNLR